MLEPRVMHRDRDLLVLYKPAGLATTAPDDAPSLVREARALDPDAPRLHPTSRLDAAVSGLVTFARTDAGNRRLLEARRRGTYLRCYLALGTSAAIEPRGHWRAHLGIDPRDPRRRVAVDPERPRGARKLRVAETCYEILETRARAMALRLWPRTGRTHQLRVQAAEAGCPLLGDGHYGGPARLVLADGRVLSFRRVMLHCAWLSLPSGAEGVLQIEAAAPRDFLEAWTALGGKAEDVRASAPPAIGRSDVR